MNENEKSFDEKLEAIRGLMDELTEFLDGIYAEYPQIKEPVAVKESAALEEERKEAPAFKVGADLQGQAALDDSIARIFGNK